MTRPVTEWQWTNSPDIFWLRMEHLPPTRADLLRETYPPADTVRPLSKQRSIRDRQLAACIDEAAETNWARTRPKKTAPAEATTRTAAQTITDRSTAYAERILGISEKENA